MFTLHTTEDIVVEVGYRMRRNNPEADGHRIHALVTTLREQTDSVITRYPPDVDYAGTDRHDGHLHAAAVAGAIDVVLTQDKALLTLDDDRYEISSPDAFLCLADDSMPHYVRQVTLEQLEYWRKQPSSRPLHEALIAAGCDEFAERVRQHCADVLSRPVGMPQVRTLSIGN